MKHHLDKRADELAAKAGDGDDDQLLTTSELAELIGMSTQWLEIGRSKQYGPPFIKLGPRIVRYRRADLRRWFEQRQHGAAA